MSKPGMMKMANITVALFITLEVDDNHPVVVEAPSRKVVLGDTEANAVTELALQLLAKVAGGAGPGSVRSADPEGE